jgi:Bacteriophage tail sheath protein
MRTLHTPGVTFEWRDASLPAIGPLRTDIAGFVGIAERGPLHQAVKIESRTQFASVFGAPLPQAFLAYAVESFFANGGNTCWIVRLADPDVAAAATLDIVDGFGARLLGIAAGSPGAWGNGIVATWIYSGSRIISLTLHYPDGTQQLIRNPQDVALPLVPNDIQIERESLPSTLQYPLIVLSQPDRGPVSANRTPIFAGQAQAAGGTDGLHTLAPMHFTGQGAPDGTTWGLVALEKARDVSIVAVPDLMTKPLAAAPKYTDPPPYRCSDIDQPAPPPSPLPQTAPEYPPPFAADVILGLQQALIGHCEKMHYRVAILDTLDNLTPDEAAAARAVFEYTNHAALYYPWILVNDPLSVSGVVRAIPPSGAVAGVYARNDLQYGVHKPPANAVAEAALDVRTQVDAIVHGDLNDANVNVIRSFPGRGIRVYGARTVANDPAWTYVNVRRLLLMIEKAVDQNSQWIVFEPNTSRLWREMDRVVRAYLESLFRAGMLDGATSDDAYLVKCDESLNPPETVDAGQVICLIGVQPPYPAEFVVVIVGKTQNALNILQESGATSG